MSFRPGPDSSFRHRPESRKDYTLGSVLTTFPGVLTLLMAVIMAGMVEEMRKDVE